MIHIKKALLRAANLFLVELHPRFFSLYDDLIELLSDQSKEEALPRFLAAAVKHSMGES